MCTAMTNNKSTTHARFWAPIADETYDFNRRWQRAEAYVRLTQADVVAFFDEFLNCDAPLRRKLSVRVSSLKHATAATSSSTTNDSSSSSNADTVLKGISEVRQFKSKQSLY
jgi:secreted Zn-dependent insulinase-like peptidase